MTAISGSRTGYLSGTTSGWAAASLFGSGDDLYAVVLDTSAVKIRVYKGTGDGTWTEQDSAHALSHSGATHSYSAGVPLTSNGYIYVAYRTATNTVRVRRFDMATDMWEATDIGAANASTTVSADYGVGVAVRSDGDVLVMYRDSGANQWLRIVRYEGTSWSAEAFFIPRIGNPLGFGMGVADMATVAFFETGSGATTFKTNAYSSGNVGQSTLGFTVDTSADPLFASHLAIINDAGTQRIGVAKIDSTNELDFVFGTAYDSLSTVDAVSDAGHDPGLMGAAVAVSGSQWYVVWSSGTAIYRDGGAGTLASPTFGTDTALVSGLGSDPAVYAVGTANGVPVLYTDPTGPSVDIVWAAGSPPAGGVAHPLAADVAGAATLTADLTAPGPGLAAAITASATLAATGLRLDHPLAAGISGGATVTANLTAGVAATRLRVSWIEFEVPGSAAALVASITGGGTLTAPGLRLSHPLAAGIAASASAGATGLRLTHPLATAMTAGATVTASGLRLTHALSAGLSGAGALSGAVSLPRALSAALSASSAATASGITVGHPLGAAIVAAGGGAADLTLPGQGAALAGAITAGLTGSATGLRLAHPLGAAISGGATLGGSLGGDIQISAAITATSSLTAPRLVMAHPLAAALVAGGTVSASQITIDHALLSGISGGAVVTASGLRVGHGLIATISAAGVVTAAFEPPVLAVGAWTGVPVIAARWTGTAVVVTPWRGAAAARDVWTGVPVIREERP